MKKKKELMLLIVGLVCLVLITVGVTYAFFNYAKEGTTDNTITTGTITFLYTEISEVGRGISIEDAYPVSDSVGKAQTGEGKVFDFKVTSNTPNETTIPYEVTVRKKHTSDLSEDAVKLYLTKVIGTSEEEILLSKYSELTTTDAVDNSKYNEKTLYKGKVPANTTDYEQAFRLRMWISDDVDFSDGTMNDKEFTVTVNVYSNAKLVVEGETNLYKELILNGTDPVLTDNLVAVTILNNGDVVKANLNEDWYSYENKRWANAVVLKDTAVSYNVGDTIPESNIESYFVWIPKYSYQLWDLGDYTSLTSLDSTKPHAIPIKFGTTNTSDSVTGECTTPQVAGESGNCEVGEYMTHPAFTSFDSNGFWVGKFETGYNGATSVAGAQVSSGSTSDIIIKPNVYSWRYLTVGSMFKLGYDYLRSDESHMMKNTEWGAVAYLHHSTYGSNTSLRINNNSNYITGYAATEEPTKGYNNGTSVAGNRVEGTALGVDGTYTVNYLNASSGVASTTGNITGVYDMSGGTYEYVAGYTTGASTVGGSSGITSIYSDFFTNSNWEKYYDKYSSTAVTNYNKRILGDATGEMGPFGSQTDPDGSARYKSSWYGDYAAFALSSYPWFYRGGHWYHGSSSGAFAFGYYTGGVDALIGFRLVLTPIK